jgi:hypothetical protein
VTLTEFLLARIAEDEAGYRAEAAGMEWLTVNGRDLWPQLLAECEAKRRIVVEMGRLAGDVRPTSNLDEDGWILLCWETLETLAAVYADHPDCDEKWVP